MNLFNPFRSSKPAPVAAAAAGAQATAQQPSPEDKARLERLFRDCTRQGAINPLMYVLTRYRARER